MTPRLPLLVCAAVALTLLLFPVPEAGASQSCDPPVYVFTRTGVFVGTGSTGTPTVDSGWVGCTAAGGGDTNYVYPGATMAAGRLRTDVGSAPSGCLTSPQGSLLAGGGYCGPWVLRPGPAPTRYYAESPWVAIEPTRISGTLEAEVWGFGRSNTYRTVDR